MLHTSLHEAVQATQKWLLTLTMCSSIINSNSSG